jgi:hypothetical protein
LPRRYRFEGRVLDTTRYELSCDGELVHVEPQVFDVLAQLVEHRDRVVPKAELLDVVWGDQFVSESALTTRIKQLRQAVGDSGREQRVVQTAHGRGYRVRCGGTGSSGWPDGTPSCATTSGAAACLTTTSPSSPGDWRRSKAYASRVKPR